VLHALPVYQQQLAATATTPGFSGPVCRSVRPCGRRLVALTGASSRHLGWFV